jgi:hypothetical protein
MRFETAKEPKRSELTAATPRSGDIMPAVLQAESKTVDKHTFVKGQKPFLPDSLHGNVQRPFELSGGCDLQACSDGNEAGDDRTCARVLIVSCPGVKLGRQEEVSLREAGQRGPVPRRLFRQMSR